MILAVLLTSVLNLPGVHRAAAANKNAGGDPGQALQQGVKPTPTDEPRRNPTPTGSSNLPPTTTPTSKETQTPLPTEIITPTQTLTPTATLTNTPTNVPTQTQAPTLTIQPCTGSACITPTPPEPTSTSIPSGTPTPEPTATPPITATETVTAAPSIPGGIDSLVQLRLGERLDWIAGGNPFTLTWGIDGLSYLPPRLVLALTLPDGFTPLGVPDGSWNPETHILTLPLSALGGWTGVDVSPDVVGPFTIHGALYRNGNLLGERDITLPQEWLTRLGVDGGIARGLSDRVEVIVPTGVLTETARVNIRHLRAEDVPYSLSGKPLEILAVDEKNGRELHQFTEPITITINYTDTQVRGEESTLTLFYFDTTEGDWEALPSRVDTVNNILVGVTDHFTAFDFNAQDWEAARLPSLVGFQVSSFTGASSYSFPIQVPPGPAGLQPSISVSYNSQTVDSASSRTQASWVGMGWSLDTGYIQRNQNGTRNYYDDDTFSLQVNGVGGTLLPVNDPAAPTGAKAYRMENDNFWRIWQFPSTGNVFGYTGDTSYWVVWDKTGTQYYFGIKLNGDRVLAHYPAYPNNCASPFMQTWQWPLTRVRTNFGQEMTYSYTMGTSVKRNPLTGCDTYNASMEIAVYPDMITYSNSRYVVQFVNASRSDYLTSWSGYRRYTFYMDKRLDTIIIWQDPNGTWNSGDEVIIRKYVFGFGERSQQIFPNVTWPNSNAKTLTLTSITEYGQGGTLSLPQTTFSYDVDAMHLSEGNNGYGGKVAFTYETNPWNELTSDDDPMFHDGGGSWFFGDKPTGCDPANYPPPGYTGTDLDTPVGVFHPGEIYKISIANSTTCSPWPGAIDFGIKYDGSTQLFVQSKTMSTEDNLQVVTGYLRVPINASQVQFFIKPGANFVFYYYKAWPVITRDRVTAKTLTDTVLNQSYTFNYRYDGPATNDSVHSAKVAGTDKDHRYTQAYSEYRGNAMVQEVGPDSRVSYSYFYQADNTSGSASASIVGYQYLTDAFESLDTGKWAFTTPIPAPSPTPTHVVERLEGDLALKSVNPAADWTVGVNRQASTLQDVNGSPNNILVQFRLSKLDPSDNPEAILAISSGNWDSSYRRWGVHAVNGSSNVTLYRYHCVGTTTCTDDAVLKTLSLDKWYVLQITLDDTANFLLRVWDRDDPSGAARWEETDHTTIVPAQRSWRFISKTKDGVLWMDEYSENRVYSISNTFYEVVNSDFAVNPVPLKDTDNDGVGEYEYQDFKIAWTRLIEQRSYTYEGEAAWLGSRTVHQYVEADQGNEQYGNETCTTQYEWDHQGNAWVSYRGTHTQYYPYVSDGGGDPTNARYLVGLAGISRNYQCSGDDCNFSDETKLLTSAWSLYDNNTANYWNQPSAGKLTGQRSLVYCVSSACDNTSNQRFADTSFGYDTWGNRTTTNVYPNEGTYTAFGQGTARTSTSCYGSGAAPTCTDDGYGTYAGWTRNPLNQTTTMTYDHSLSVPLSETDPNGAATYAYYDDFGRITQLVKPGDTYDSNPNDATDSATMYFQYHDTNPFWTESRQKITDGQTSFTLRKFYNGLGQKLQIQTIGAKVGTQDRDILVDYLYDAYGRVTEQSVPYDVAMGSGYRTPLSKPFTQTDYDVMGRAKTVTATDHTTTNTTYALGYYTSGSAQYAYMETCVIDARSNQTCSRNDARGRTMSTTPKNASGATLNPVVSYTYDAADHLTDVNQGSIHTQLVYDLSGRKTKMIDPDMGAWYYSYDILGNMANQTDARNQMQAISQDIVGRTTTKFAPDGTNTTFIDTFDTKNTTNWTWSSYQTVPYNDGGNYVVKSTGQGNYNANFYRNGGYALSDGEGVQLRFKVDSGTSSATFAIETGSGASYRRLQAIVAGNNLYVQYTIDGTNYYSAGNLISPVELNTWYRLQIVIDDRSGFVVQAFKESDPSKRGFIRFAMPSQLSWRFHHWIYQANANAYIDDYRESNSVVYTYDAGTNGIGRRTSMSDPSGSTTWTYDNRGRVTQEQRVISGTNGGTFKTEWGYFSSGAVSWMKYPTDNNGNDSEQVYYGLNRQMGLKSVSGSSTYVYDTTYDAAGQVLTRVLGSSVLTQSYAYYAWDTQGGRIHQLTAGTIQDLSYTYDSVGNVLTIVDTKAPGGTQTQIFTYDAMDRLYTAQATGGTDGTYTQQTYTYDTNGRLNGLPGVGTYQYCDANHQHAVLRVGSDCNATQKYWYDSNGNMTKRISSSTYDMTYDAQNHLVGVATGATASFVYDGDGTRVKSTLGSTTTTFIGNYFEWSGSTSTMVRYYYAGGVRAAMRTGSGTGTSNVKFLLGDHLNSTGLTVNYDLTGKTELRYYPWGTVRSVVGTTTMKYTYTGQYSYATGATNEFGLIYYGARFYDPTIGRFTQPDTNIPQAQQGTQAWDRFAYVNNNPLRYVDPTGKYTAEVHYDLTFQLAYNAFFNAAKNAGKSVTEAENLAWGMASTIAGADKGVDSNPKYKAGIQKGDNPLEEAQAVINQCEAYPHKESTDYAMGNLNNLIGSESTSGNDIGEALHVLQDSFSHIDKIDALSWIPAIPCKEGIYAYLHETVTFNGRGVDDFDYFATEKIVNAWSANDMTLYSNADKWQQIDFWMWYMTQLYLQQYAEQYMKKNTQSDNSR